MNSVSFYFSNINYISLNVFTYIRMIVAMAKYTWVYT